MSRVEKDRPVPSAAPSPVLLECIPEEGARRLALRWIDDALEASSRLVEGSDPEALHDMRVALRKLRTVLGTYTDALRGGVRRKRKKKLKALVGETGAGRDAEVQIAWLESVRGELEGGAQRGVQWLIERLEVRKRESYARMREDVVPALRELLPKLRRDLARYEIEHVVLEPRGAPRFATATAALLREQAEELREKLRRVQSIEQEELAHEARKDGKRLRYLLEPLRDEEVAGAKEIVKRLKGLQDLLGELNDVAVRSALLRNEITEAALERAKRLADEAEGHASDGITGASEGDEQLGLLALVRTTHDRRLALFERIMTEWIAGEGALDTLRGEVDSFADELAGRDAGPPREIERKYLLSGMPAHARAFPCVSIEQGYVPGETLHERLRRTKRDGAVRCYRTVKLGFGISRIEIEEETTGPIFSRMWALTRGKRVRKRRWKVEEGEHTWEIDEFRDRDLVLAEIELASEDAEVTIPEWLQPFVVREVTDEPEFSNLHLAK